MGTRNLTVVYQGGRCRLAKYCQWDGYPESKGIGVLQFLRELVAEDGLAEFADKVAAVAEPTKDEVKEIYGKYCDSNGFATFEQSRQLEDDYPELHRNTGGRAILEMIRRNDPGSIRVENKLDFAADSLFCEWLWLVDLDSGTFEGYRGFNTEPLQPDDRFYAMPKVERSSTYLNGKTYYPVKMVASWPLSALPTDEEFMKAFVFEEDDE